MIKIYGKNCVNEAIRAHAKIEEVVLEDDYAKKEGNFILMLEEKQIKHKIISKKEMTSAFGDKAQGIGAYRFDYEIKELDSFLKDSKNSKRILILDGISDPHNFGAILRSCDAFGVDAVILPKNRSVSVTETVAHVSTGAIEYVNIIYVNNLITAIKSLKDNGFWIVGTDAMADKLTSDIDLSLNLGIIIGSEGYGISRIVKENVDFMVKIPMKGHVNSLNASVSCGIILENLCKQ